MRYSFCPKCGSSLQIVTNKNAPQCTSCSFIFYQNPIVGVAAIVIHNKKLLLGKRNNESGYGKWCIPSGYVEYDEEVREAAKREFFEETGLNIKIKDVYEVHSNFHNPKQHTVGIWFLAEVISGNLAASDDLSEVQYFSYTEITELAFPTDRLVIDKLKKDGYL